MRAPLSVAAACLLGVLQCYVVLLAWPYIGAPVTDWLAHLGLTANTLRAAALVTDFLIYLALALPVSFALIKLHPAKRMWHLLLAVLAALTWLTGGFAGSMSPGWIPALLAIPTAGWLLTLCVRAPNNSFKPKPLRGSA